MRKTYFLLLLSVVLSWQVVSAYFDSDFSWSLNNYLNLPKLSEITTKVSSFFDEDLNNISVNENKVSEELENAPSKKLYPTQNLSNYTLYSCTVGTVTGTYSFDFTKLLEFYLVNNQFTVPRGYEVELFYTQADVDNDNPLTTIPVAYEAVPGTIVFVKVTNTNTNEETVYEVPLQNLESSQLIVTPILTRGGVCYGETARFEFRGTPGAVVNYTLINNSTTTTHSITIEQNGQVFFSNDRELYPGGTSRIIINSITLGSCTKTYGPTEILLNVPVRQFVTATLSFADPSNSVLCTSGNEIPVRLTITGVAGLVSTVNYTVNGQPYSQVVNSSPFTLLVSAPANATGDVVVRVTDITTSSSANPFQCITEITNTGATLNIPLSANTTCTAQNLNPFCYDSEGDSSFEFPNVTGQPNSTRLFCLGTIPNPSWYFMEVDQAGTLNYTITQSTSPGGSPNLDVDFIAYGPFTGSLNPLDLENTKANICCQISQINIDQNQGGNAWEGKNNIIGCSYSAAPTENFTIPNAQPGEIYVVLITNFNGRDGFIELEENASSTGSTSCDIVCPLYLGEDFTVCPGTVITLRATIDNATYQWYKDGVPLAGETGQSLTTVDQGLFEVVVNKTGCKRNQSDDIRITHEVSFPVNDVPDLLECFQQPFNLTTQNAALVADPSQYIFTYYESEDNAIAGTNAISNVNAYIPSTYPKRIYVTIRSRVAVCPVFKDFLVDYENCPSTPGDPDDLYLCENPTTPGSAEFNLTHVIDQVLGAPVAGHTYTISVYPTQADATNGTNQITNTTSYEATNGTVVWFKKQDDAIAASFGFTSTTLFVIPNPVANFVNTTDVNVCINSNVNLDVTGTSNANVDYTLSGDTTTHELTLDANGNGTISIPNIQANTTITIVGADIVIDANLTCSSVLNNVININVTPSSELTVSSNVQACLNATSPVITLTPSQGVAPYTVLYTINGGAVQTAIINNPTLDIVVPTNVAGVFVYDFISIEGSGSSSCVADLDLQVTATIYDLPTASLIGNAEVCTNEVGTYTIVGTPNATVVYTIGGVNQTAVLDVNGEFQFTQTISTNVTIGLVSILDASGCINTLTESINVNAVNLPTATISGSTSICSGTSTTFTINGTPGATVTYTVNGTPQTGVIDATTGSLVVNTGDLTATTTYELVSIQGACSNTLTGSISITVIELPTASISGTTQVCLNGAQPTVTFTGSNGVAPYTFTYTINGGAAQTVTSTTNTVTVNVPTTTAGVYVYELVSVISSSTPNCSATVTGSASVTVLELPTASVTATANVCEGEQGTITFTGTANATVTYTVNGVNQTLVLDINGYGTATTIVNANVTVTLVSIINTESCTNSLSQSVTITKVDLPTATITGSTSICSGSTAVLTINGTPNAVVTFSANGQVYTVTLGTDGSGRFTTPSLTATTTYELVSIAGACSNSLTGSVTVTVLELPTANVSGAQTICNGNNATVQITGTPNSTVTYTVNGVTQSVVLGNSGSANVTLNGLTANTTVQLVNIATNATVSCTASLTESILITVIPVPTITNVSVAANTICSGETTGIQLTGNTSDVEFRWTVVANGATGASAGRGNVISQQLNSGSIERTVVYTIVPYIGGCEGDPVQVSILVTPVPVVTLSASTIGICTNENINVAISSNVTGAFYTWNAVATNGIQGATGGTGNVINQTLINNSDQVGTVTYTVTPYYANCQGQPKTVVVTVYPKPRVIATPVNEFVCSGNATNISLSSNIANVTYNWTVIANGVSGATPGSGNQIRQVLTAVGVVGTVEYIVTPTVNGCVGDPVSILVTVTPTPEIFANSNPPAICSESFTGISLSASIAGTTFEWTVVQNGVEGAFAGSGSEINQQLFTTGNTQGTAVYTVTPFSNGCQGAPITIRVRVNPLPAPRLTEGYICYDPIKDQVISTYTLNSGLSNSAYTFVWSLDGNIIPGAITNTYTATQAGQYTLQVTNNATNCSTSQTVTVSESNPAVSASYELTNYFDDAQTITINVVGNGEYIYQLDDFTPQSSNVFTNVLPGTHRVTITDTNGCTYIVIDNIVTMHYPNFFTPNGDGVNDTWNIWSLSDQDNAMIYIYDRHGKLIKQISPRGSGWDGTSNGAALPSTDYWFVVEYFENGQLRTFRSHFSLKR